jgi:inhibitor of KinA sporulation pathway (predicted exonuclease)
MDVNGKCRQYIVFDLEWNQSSNGLEEAVKKLPFEIIEIGAVKLDQNLKEVGEFSRLVKPSVYGRLHYKVLEIMRIGMEELREKGTPFPEVMRDFLNWCGKTGDGEAAEPVFCTWGSMDLTELQKNMAYYGMENPFSYPLLYYDVQKLFNLLYEENSKNKLPLDHASELLGIIPDKPFHRAADDARYTGMVMEKMDFSAVKDYLSLDYYHIPENEEEEISLVFPNYSKYVSRKFETREDTIGDKTVTDMICCKCSRMLHKKIRWFSSNQRNYYCLAWCPEHGFMRGKIRIKHAPDGKCFAIKTIKPVGEDGVRKLEEKKEETTLKRNLKNRLKRTREKKRDG